jgi:hypothetical protein
MGLLSFANPAMWLVNIGIAGLGYLLYKPKRNQKTKPPDMEFKMSAVKIGTPIPVVLGYAKVGGLIIEWGDWTVVAHKKRIKGGKAF